MTEFDHDEIKRIPKELGAVGRKRQDLGEIMCCNTDIAAAIPEAEAGANRKLDARRSMRKHIFLGVNRRPARLAEIILSLFRPQVFLRHDQARYLRRLSLHE